MNDETSGFDPFIHALFVKAMSMHEKLLAEEPLKQKAIVQDMSVSFACAIVVFWLKNDDMKLSIVAERSEVDDIRDLPLNTIQAFIAPDEWTLAAWKIAAGDGWAEGRYLSWLAREDDDAYRRLPKWVTPAGYTERLRLHGDREAYEAHAELVLVDRFVRALTR